MCLIDHQPGAVALFQLDQLRQVGDVAVHRVQTLDDDERVAAGAPVRAQQALQMLEVVVAERECLGVRQLDAGEQAVVGELVVENEIVGIEQRADGRDVGGVAADEGDGGLGLVEVGQRGFELAMQRPLPGDDAAGRHRRPVLVDRRLGCRDDHGMAVEPEIVVGGEVDVVAPVDGRQRTAAAVMAAIERVGEVEAVGDHAVLDDGGVSRQVGELLRGRERSRLGILQPPARPGAGQRRQHVADCPFNAQAGEDEGPGNGVLGLMLVSANV